MKKFVVCFIILLCGLFAACGESDLLSGMNSSSESASNSSTSTDGVTNFAVAFDSTGGTAVETQTIARGEKITEPQGVTREGYTFEGWYTDGAFTTKWNFTQNTVTQNVTLYAKWTQNPPGSFTVTFVSNCEKVAAPQVVQSGGQAAEPQGMTREGYTLEGWYNENTFASSWDFDTDTVTHSVTLYAKWDPITYTVRYDKNNAEAAGSMADSAHTYGIAKALTANAYTRAGYFFVQWTTEPDGSGTAYTDGQSISSLAATEGAVVILYARWVPESFNVINTAEWNAAVSAITGSGNNK
jgi:uncharacterized repeat protein (TIGR02543 family)